MILLIVNKKVTPITGWEKLAFKLEAWTVLCKVFLGNKIKYPATYEMFLLIEETSGVIMPQRVQAHQYTTSPRRPHTLDPAGFQQELPSGVGEAAEGPVKGIQELEEGSRNRKLQAQACSPPRGDHSARTVPLYTGGASKTRDNSASQHNRCFPQHPRHRRYKDGSRRWRIICTHLTIVGWYRVPDPHGD